MLHKVRRGETFLQNYRNFPLSSTHFKVLFKLNMMQHSGNHAGITIYKKVTHVISLFSKYYILICYHIFVIFLMKYWLQIICKGLYRVPVLIWSIFLCTPSSFFFHFPAAFPQPFLPVAIMKLEPLQTFSLQVPLNRNLLFVKVFVSYIHNISKVCSLLHAFNWRYAVPLVLVHPFISRSAAPVDPDTLNNLCWLRNLNCFVGWEGGARGVFLSPRSLSPSLLFLYMHSFIRLRPVFSL